MTTPRSVGKTAAVATMGTAWGLLADRPELVTP